MKKNMELAQTDNGLKFYIIETSELIKLLTSAGSLDVFFVSIYKILTRYNYFVIKCLMADDSTYDTFTKILKMDEHIDYKVISLINKKSLKLTKNRKAKVMAFYIP